MPELKIDAAKRLGAPLPVTTTLALSGLGASEEERSRARKAGITLPPYVRRLHLLLYGPPKTGKTVAAHSLPNTRTLDIDDGMQSVHWAIATGKIKKRPEEIVYATIKQPAGNFKSTYVIDAATDVVDGWLADENIPPSEWDKPYPQFWDTLIIDGGTGMTEAAIVKALSENNRLGLSKSFEKLKEKLGITPMMIQDWGSAASLFMKALTQWRAIGKNIVLICHEYAETDENGTVLSYDPLLIGQLRQKIPGSFDEVWYMMVEGTRKDPKYLFQTTPDSRHRLGSRLGCLDPVESSDFAAIKKKIAKFYGVNEETLWVAAHGTEEIEAEQERSFEESGGI